MRRRGQLLALVGMLSLAMVMLVPFGHVVERRGVIERCCLTGGAAQRRSAGCSRCSGVPERLGLRGHAVPDARALRCGRGRSGQWSRCLPVRVPQLLWLRPANRSSSCGTAGTQGSLRRHPRAWTRPDGDRAEPVCQRADPERRGRSTTASAWRQTTARVVIRSVVSSPTCVPGQTQLPTSAPCGQANSSGGSNPPGAPFFCDESGDNCSIDITEPGLESHAAAESGPQQLRGHPRELRHPLTACTTAHPWSRRASTALTTSSPPPTRRRVSAKGANAYVPSDTHVSGLAAVQADAQRLHADRLHR